LEVIQSPLEDISSMEIQEILRPLEYYDGALPRRALEEAIANKERITPALMKIIEDSTSRMEALLADKD